MPVLFALSILAFVALLWATISIAGFVRRARRRKRRRADDPLSAAVTRDPFPTVGEESVLPPCLDAAPPPIPVAAGIPALVAHESNAAPENAFFLSEDEIPASVDGVALPPFYFGHSASPPSGLSSLPKPIHSDAITKINS